MGQQELEPDWRGHAAMTTPGEQILYIVGNGFDLYHGIPSSYAAFGRYLKFPAVQGFPTTGGPRPKAEFNWINFNPRMRTFMSALANDSVLKVSACEF